MSLKKNQLVRIFAFLMASAILTPGIGYCLSDEEIFAWVANQLDINETYSMPTVNLVDKQGIQKAFVEGNRNGYMRWENQYGKDKADEILKVYLDEIVGLFNEKSRSIFVATFMSPCRQQAVLAHEFVHFFQYVTEGPVVPGTFQEDIARMTREMKAYAIEKRFEEYVCQEDNLPPVASQSP